MPVLRWLLQWRPAILLGLATIGAYGTAYYAIGMLLPVIHDATGWSNSALAIAVSLSSLGQGGIALMAGRMLDRLGSGLVLLPGLIAGSTLLFASSFAVDAWQLIVLWALGASFIGGSLYYNVTMPVVSRLFPGQRPAAFSVLTLLGALASPIFYPLTGFLLTHMDWQATLRVLVAVTILCAAPAAVFLRTPVTATRQVSQSWYVPPAARRLLIVVAIAGLANSALLLNQVPAMQAAGITVATSSWLAGVRGLCQIPGRLLLNPLTSRFGVRGGIVVCYIGATTAGMALLLALDGRLASVGVLYFCVLGGMSLGLLSPLNGLLQSEVFGEARLGSLSGVTVCVASLSSASGAFLSGLLLDATSSYGLLVAAVLALYCVALLALHRLGRALSDEALRDETVVATQ